MTSKRKANNNGTASDKKQKRQSDLATGFAAQILKSPKKVNAYRTPPVTLEIDDSIEISSDEDRQFAVRRPFGKPKTSRNNGAAHTQIKVKLEESEPPSSSALSQQSKSTQTIPEEEISWLDLVPLRKTTDLAVHKNKVAAVQEWIEGAFKNVTDRTVLILTGPAGVGKTATIETLGKVLDYEIIEWRNPMSAEWSEDVYNRDADSLAQKFERFLAISDKYSALDFGQDVSRDHDDGNRRKVIVVEDIPNTFSSNHVASSAKLAFQNSILRYLSSPRNKYPLILIITETEPRGEGGDWSRSDAMSTRTLLTRDILDSRNCTLIAFNDVAPTFISKALARIVDALPREHALDISQAVLDEIAQTANGDIRSACNSLQFIAHRFSTRGRLPRPRRKRKRGEILTLTKDEITILNIVTNRESALGYFHAIGKVIYNKRVPSSQDSYDALPTHLTLESRSRPETSAECILQETSTDEMTFLSGIHQNYIPSTTLVSHASSLCDALSYADCISHHHSDTEKFSTSILKNLGGLIGVLGSLHALPQNVTRHHIDARIFFPPYKVLSKRRAETSDALVRYRQQHHLLLGSFESQRLFERVSYHVSISKAAGVAFPDEKLLSFDKFTHLGKGGVDASATLVDDSDEIRYKKGRGMNLVNKVSNVQETVQDDDIEEV